MFKNNFLSANICLILVTIQKIQSSDETNKKVIGKMKVEFEGNVGNEFVGLKSKMYFMETIDGKESNTAKEVNITTEFNELLQLFNKKVVRHKMKQIKSKKHKLGTYEANKISSCFDDKTFVLNDGIHTLGYFHIDIDSHG